MDQDMQNSQINNAVPQKSKSYMKFVIFFIVGLTFLIGMVTGLLIAPKKDSQPTIETKTVTPTPPATPTTTPETNLKTFTDVKAGFSFKYPATITVNEPVKKSSKILITTLIEKITDIPEEQPLGYDRKTAIKDRSELSNGRIGERMGWGNFYPEQPILLDNKVYGKGILTYDPGATCSQTFLRSLVFYHNDYQIKIFILGPEEIMESMPEIFHDYYKRCGTDNTMTAQFTKRVESGTASNLAMDWYNTFDIITSTLKLTD